jgi:DNA helicase-2/ATP-dependent DNA helicase PcrA
MDTMADLRAAAERGTPVGELLEAMLSQSGYLDALEAEARQGASLEAIKAQGRIENLEQLVEVGREFDASAEGAEAGLDLFLQEIALKADADSRRDDEGLVTLMTLHNAKGLEYPVVFIAGCEDGVFPHSRAIDEGALEEERRLFYVGITRAERNLYLTHARRRMVFGSSAGAMRSRFLDELPRELLDVHEDPLRPLGAGLGSYLGAGAPRAARGPGSASAWTVGSSGDTTLADTFRLGEDIVHAAFGEGVVTGVEPDGVIVVRFAGDGSERKLMAEYAPVSRR